jgi:hypothetical protein
MRLICVMGRFHPAADRSFRPMPPLTAGNGYARAGRKDRVAITLEPDQSATLREKLLTELATIRSADLATAWAQEALPAKNGSPRPMLSLWRMPLNEGYRSSHHPMRLYPQTMSHQGL